MILHSAVRFSFLYEGVESPGGLVIVALEHGLGNYLKSFVILCSRIALLPSSIPEILMFYECWHLAMVNPTACCIHLLNGA